MSKEFVIPTKMMRNMKIDQLNQNRIERVDYETINLIKRGAEDGEEKVFNFETINVNEFDKDRSDGSVYDLHTAYNFPENSTRGYFQTGIAGREGFKTHFYIQTLITLTSKVKFLLNDLKIYFDNTMIYYEKGVSFEVASSPPYATKKTLYQNMELQKVEKIDKTKNCYQIISSIPQELKILVNFIYEVYSVEKLTVSYMTERNTFHNYDLKIKAPYYDEEIENKFFGIENSDYTFTLESSNFYNKDTLYNGVELGEYNAQKILDNYNFGKEKVNLECVIGNYYDRNNNLIYSKNSQKPIMDIGDTFELYNPLNKSWENGYYHKKFVIVDREFSYNGVPTIKITGKEK